MDIKIQETNPTRRSITVTIPAADVTSTEQEVLKGFTREASLPGFRPGKAPAAIVRAKYGKNIADEVSQRLLARGYEKIREEKGFIVYSLADVQKDETAAAGKDVVIRYEVDVVPEFKTPNWSTIRIERETVKVTDADVEEHLQKIREQRARYEKTEEPAAKGDYVRLGYQGTINGQPIASLDAEAKGFAGAESTWEEAGSESEIVSIPSLNQAVIGKKAGDEAKAEYTFPATHEREALRGKTATYAITISEVRRKNLPAIDEAFFKSVGVADEKELRDQLQQGITNAKEQAAETARREKAVDALLAGVDFPLPDSAVESVAQSLFYEYLQLRMRNGTMKPEDMASQQEEIMAESRKAAAIRVRAQFVLSRIAEENKLELSREELGMAVMRAAQSSQTPPEKLVKDRQRLTEIRRDALLNKALDLVLAASNEGGVEKK